MSRPGDSDNILIRSVHGRGLKSLHIGVPIRGVQTGDEENVLIRGVRDLQSLHTGVQTGDGL
ncbi:SGNH/GDSL hydrolase family protein [Sesbania bispinosa]|nr:SGNH/GDSL hydrolase family protein [Sesbania bispinosa]